MISDNDLNESQESFESSQATPGTTVMPSISAATRVELAALSHPGNEGRPNEDHYLVLRVERLLDTVLTSLPETVLPRRFDDVAYGILVADGLGGMPAGKVASATVLAKFIELTVNTPDWVMKMNRRKAALVKHRMSERFRKVDEALRQRAEKDSALTGMSSTLTVACSLGADLFLGHVGDSRAYLLRGARLHQLTRDHTLAQALIDAGVGEAENALVRGMRRVLTAALGMKYLSAEPQVQHLQLSDGDQLLLCTDGLSESLEADVIESVLRRAGSAAEACGELIEAALNNNGADDMTVILARYGFPRTV